MLDDINLYRAILDSLPVPMFIKDADHRFVFVNRMACEYFGVPVGEIVGKSDYDYFPAQQADVFRDVDRRVLTTGDIIDNEEFVTDQSGVQHTVITSKSLLQVGQQRYVLATISDITALREAQARTEHLAYHDTLTGLPNRASLYERLNQLLATPGERRALSFVLVDLDGFKNVNDTHGHQAGDELLREFGRRLMAMTGAQDMVVRMGGDEFAVLVCSDDLNHALEALCVRIVEAAAQPFEVVGVQSYVHASLGVFRLGSADLSAGEVVRKADTALYEAKHQGKGRYHIYSPELDCGLLRRRAIESELAQALMDGSGLACAYQPLVRTTDGRIAGVEALIRWQSARLGKLSPAEFIPIAEETGLIARLGEWVLKRACHEALPWNDIYLAVNISSVQLRNRRFAETVMQILQAEGFPASRLELEITETAIINVDEVSMEQLRRLRAAGIRISLDDFGTGYSSIRLLRDMELDKVKIDQSFVQFVTQAKDSAAIVETLARLGTTLGLQVVAEGVETEEQRQFLQDAGCNCLQGYLFSIPVAAPSIAALLDGDPVLSASGRKG